MVPLAVLVAMPVLVSTQSIRFVNISARGPEWQGLGGLSAGASSRLLLDYIEPTRSHILDLLFKPSGGTAWQIIKTEIGGDGQSSYGSETAVMHTEGDISYKRGYELWLIQEAKKRNPEIKTSCLSWAEPGWVGKFLSPKGVKYHIDYLSGVRDNLNLSFDYTGIWNERAWSGEYILELREAMNSAGFAKTKIIAADGPSHIFDTLEQNSSAAGAVDIVGIHSVLPLTENDGIRAQKLGKPLWNSEGNVIDGGMWPDGKYSYALEWVRQVLANYIHASATGMVQCPAFHAWSQNLGRHNHGSAYFNDPWSGYYELGAPFWAQAHISQFTKPGWHFVPLESGGGGMIEDNVSYIALASPLNDEFSIVIINYGSNSASFTLNIQGLQTPSSVKLHVWRTTVSSWFVPDGTAILDSNGSILDITMVEQSIATFSTVSTGEHVRLVVPQRSIFPLPWYANFDDQLDFHPPRFFSDAYGSFEVHTLKEPQPNKVVRQSVQQEVIPWTAERAPFTVLPSGTNWMNYEVSLQASFGRSGFQNSSRYLRLCGRVPVWPLRNEAISDSPPLGVCLTVRDSGAWDLTQRNNTKQTKVIATGEVHRQYWYDMSLHFDAYRVAATIANQTAEGRIDLAGGVAGFGSGLHYAYFDNFSIDTSRPAQTGSFVLDIAPAQRFRNDYDGWLGTALDLRREVRPIRIVSLGRYFTPNSEDAHCMTIVRARDNVTVVPVGTAVVDMGSCKPDLVGFCYTAPFAQPVTLEAGEVYFIVSEERRGGDSFIEMYDPGATSTYDHRIATTLLTNRQPGFGQITGRIYSKMGKWNIIEDTDTMYGPVNWIIAQDETLFI